MTGNTFGKNFKITTFGESHGPGLGVIIEGVPSQILLSQEDIQNELNKRKPGQSSVTTPRKEQDEVEILSGIFEGKTLGTPIALLIKNHDADAKNYEKIKDIFRPGHADLGYFLKYGFRDYRGGGRSSGRETVARVAAGAVAKKILTKYKVETIAYTSSIGNIIAAKLDFSEIEKNIVRCPDAEKAKEMISLIETTAQAGDSLGGTISVIIKNMPIGIGEPVFDKLEAVLGHALLSIGAIKGVEFGQGFKVAEQKGSENNDEYFVKDNKIKSKKNLAGGILGGISTGEDITILLAVKPTPSIKKAQKTVNEKLESVEIAIEGRHDPCLCPRLVPVVEAMINIAVLDLIF